MFKRFIADEAGATSIEYALIASLIAVTILASIRLLGDNTSAMYEEVKANVDDANSN